jgi:hypothetical protein
MWGVIDGVTTIPADALVSWGARTIKTSFGIDCLYDRQQFNGLDASKEHPLSQMKRQYSFLVWVNAVALKKVRKWSTSVSASDSSLFSFDDEKKGMHVRATCASSYGYVYVTAWADVKGKPL